MAKGLTAAKAKTILEDGTIRGKALTEKQKKFFGAIAGGATPLQKLNGGWLDKFDNGGVQPNYNDSNVSLPPGFKGWGYNTSGESYNGAWNGPVAQDGKRVADIATRWEMNEIDSGRPPLNIVEKVRSWFDPDSCVRDNTCVQTVKDIQSEAGIYAIPDDVYNNREFLKNYKQYGFTEITDEKDLQPGDILQYYSRDEKEAEKDPNYVDFPYHMGIYVSPGEYIGDGDSKAPTQRKNMYYEYDSKGTRYDKDPFRIFRYTPPKKQMGGSLPGATGMMYARTSGTSPEEPKKAQNGGAMVSQYEEPAWYEKVLDYAASPMTTLGYLARGEDLPDRLPINVPERSEYDTYNFDMINPAAWIKYGASARRNFEEGEYLDSAFDALSAMPILPAWLSKGKKPAKAATKAAKNVGKDVETEPLQDLFIQPNIYPTSSPLPKNMEPYLSKRVYPFNKEQEVFESFLPTEAQLKNIDLKSIRYDADGNIIPNMEYGGEIDEAQWGRILKAAKNLYNSSKASKSLKNFKSEIDWAKWNKEIPDNKALMQEYNAIEQQAKADGTWMKNPDGTPAVMPDGSTPSPELWIQSQSKNWEKAYGKKGFDNIKNVYRGASSNNPTLINFDGYTAVFTGDKKLASSYAGYGGKDRFYSANSDFDTGINELALKNSDNSISFNATKDDWLNLQFLNRSKKSFEYNIKKNKEHLNQLESLKAGENGILNLKQSIEETKRNIQDLETAFKDYNTYSKNPKYQDMVNKFYETHGAPDSPGIMTDDLAKYLEKEGLDNIQIKNIFDGDFGNINISNQVPGNYLKSLRGNNGMFDMTNPNIYKAIIPGAIGVGAASQIGPVQEDGQFKNGGEIDKAQWGALLKLAKKYGSKAVDYLKGFRSEGKKVANTANTTGKLKYLDELSYDAKKDIRELNYKVQSKTDKETRKLGKPHAAQEEYGEGWKYSDEVDFNNPEEVAAHRKRWIDSQKKGNFLYQNRSFPLFDETSDIFSDLTRYDLSNAVRSSLDRPLGTIGNSYRTSYGGVGLTYNFSYPNYNRLSRESVETSLGKYNKYKTKEDALESLDKEARENLGMFYNAMFEEPSRIDYGDLLKYQNRDGGDIPEAQFGRILKFLKNAYKYNPWAFKPNPEAYYRGVGKEGIEDALKSRVIRSRDQDLFPSPYFARPNEFETALYYNPKALIEAKGVDVSKVNKIKPDQIIFKNKDAGATPLNPNWVDEVYLGNNTPGIKFSQLEGIPIDNPNIKLLQKDWLRGYKEVPKQEEGGVIEDDRGQWAYPGEITKINSNNITMKGVNYPVLGISDTGDTKMMQPGKDYKFKGNSVTEFPMAQKGMNAQDGKNIQQLDEVVINGVRNTPEWKAYQDSLYLYNQAEKDIKAGKAYDYLRERYSDPEKRKKYEKAIGQSLEEEIRDYGIRDYEFYKKGLAKKLRDYDIKGESWDNTYGLDLYQESYNPSDWYTHMVPLNQKIQPIEVLWGPESQRMPIYKKPTKPKETPLKTLVQPEGYKFYNPTAEPISPLPEFAVKEVPYNISMQRFPGEEQDGFRYGTDGKGNLVKIQTREDYRSKNLRPNGKEYKNGGALAELDQLTNFTNYNTPQPGGWLDKYQ
jgi:hypothetical protein